MQYNIIHYNIPLIEDSELLYYGLMIQYNFIYHNKSNMIENSVLLQQCSLWYLFLLGITASVL